MNHYGNINIPDAKFKSDSSSSFGDIMSQNFPRKKGTSHEIRLFTPENGFNFKTMSFYVQNRSFRPKIDPLCQFKQFSSIGKIFHFQNF